MKFVMKKLLLTTFLCYLVFVGAAYAESISYINHYSRLRFHQSDAGVWSPNYSTLEFANLSFRLDPGISYTNKAGTLEIPATSYVFRHDTSGETTVVSESEGAKLYELAFNEDMDASPQGTFINSSGISSELGLSGKMLTWDLDIDGTTVTAYDTVPSALKTTEKQLAEDVIPYVEVTNDSITLKGVKVNADKTDWTEAPMPYSGYYRIEVTSQEGLEAQHRVDSETTRFDAGEMINLTKELSFFEVSDMKYITRICVTLTPDEFTVRSPDHSMYTWVRWNFYPAASSSSYINHYSELRFQSEADVWSPNYGTTVFDNLSFRFAPGISGTTKSGTMEIPAASYVFRHDTSGETTVVSESEGAKLYELRFQEYMDDTTDVFLHGAFINSGDISSELGLSGKRLKWNLDIDGTIVTDYHTVPSALKTTEKQLAEDVIPYVEVTNDSITLKSVKVNADRTDWTEAPMPYSGLYRVEVHSKERLGAELRVDETILFDVGDSINLTKELSFFEVSDMKYITRICVTLTPDEFKGWSESARATTWTWVRWNFYPESSAAEVQPSVGGNQLVVRISKTDNGNVVHIPEGSILELFFKETSPTVVSFYGLGAKIAEAAEGEYGPYEVTIEKEGELVVDFDNLKPAAGATNAPANLPKGNYSLWYESEDGEWLGEVAGVAVAESGNKSPNPSSSGGCNILSGIIFMIIPLIALSKRKK